MTKNRLPELVTVGLDVGGTNTDGVIISPDGRLHHWVKVPTTLDNSEGILSALRHLIDWASDRPLRFGRIVLGTTRGLNALCRRQHLARVGVLRLNSRRGAMYRPGCMWPSDLRNPVIADYMNCSGGHYFDGREIAALDERAVVEALIKFKLMGMEALALVGVFASIYPEHEDRAEEMARDQFGDDFPITKSYEMGSIGFVERENSAILNSALIPLMSRQILGLKKRIAELLPDADFFLSQNNGTLLETDQAMRQPLLTLCSGTTNSIVGAGFLCRSKDATVIDIGGTTADCGLLYRSYPRRSFGLSTVGGVEMDFPMPDVHSIAFGKRLSTQDIRYLAAQVDLAGQYDLVLVGGGALKFANDPSYFIPEGACVANAIGAAMAQPCRRLNAILEWDVRGIHKDNCQQALKELIEHHERQLARDLVRRFGGCSDSTQVVAKEVVPFHYMDKKRRRVQLKLEVAHSRASSQGRQKEGNQERSANR